MNDKDFLLVLLFAWLLLTMGLIGVQVVVGRRFLRRMEAVLGGKLRKRRIDSSLNQKEYAWVSFDPKSEVFCWNGEFEGHNASYSLNAETGYACLKLEEGDSALTTYQYIRNISQSRITSLIPYKMEVNGRTIYNTSLMKDSGEKKLAYEILKDYFKNGLKRNTEYLSRKADESIDALILGYHITKRFSVYLKKAYPDFSSEMENYERRPLGDNLDAFRPIKKTEDELAIEIKRAVFEEDYERAARIKDQIKKMNAPDHHAH